MRRSKCRGRAFSLVELLVVMVLVALGLGLLAPQLGRVRRAATGAGCLGNLRSWGSATLGHAAENGDFLPPDGAGNGTSQGDAWYVDLPPHLGQRPYGQQPGWRTNPAATLPRTVWLCPANGRRSDGRMLFHYCLNRMVNGSGPEARPLRWGDLPEPARTVWLFDNGRESAVAAAANVHRTLHRDGANLLFLDGHAARMPRAAYWEDGRNRPRTNHPDLRWHGRD